MGELYIYSYPPIKLCSICNWIQKKSTEVLRAGQPSDLELMFTSVLHPPPLAGCDIIAVL